MLRGSDGERFYQCLTCLHTESCNLDEKSKDERGRCKEYCVDKVLEKRINTPNISFWADNTEIIS